MGNAKRSKTSKTAVSAAVADNSGTSSKSEESIQYRSALTATSNVSPILTKGQLNTLILLAFTVSRILQIGGARSGLTNDSEDIAQYDGCVAHLGEEACRDVSVQSLLSLKYHSALVVLAVAVAIILPIWSSPQQLLRLNSLFVVAPLLLIVSALSFLHALAPATKTSNVMIVTLLMLLAAPTEYLYVPFLHGRRSSKITQGSRLPSLVLMVLIFVKGQAIMTTCSDLLANGDNIKAGLATPALTMTSFLLIDRFTEISLYFFAWYEHQRSQQATTALLLAFVYAIDSGCFLLLGNQQEARTAFGSDEYWSGESTRCLILSALCGLVWMTTKLSWRTPVKSH
ncbi:hypothetical protein MPSEU_001065000 [Mayamaea pseudoterrestris]|nr:hypothetical protein MPSEU_001065000 [Mayamaea pseudoterrestris]